jgi:Fic family protein
MSISQKFALYTHPAHMEPLLPSEQKLGALLEQAGDLIRAADRLAGMCQPGALAGLRGLLRAMNSYYSNRIEGQHTLPLEIEQALRNDYSNDADLARRQRLALAHMQTEAQLEQRSIGRAAGTAPWSAQQVWGVQMVQDIHQDLFARLPEGDRTLEDGTVLQPGALRTQQVSVGVHAAPDAAQLPQFLGRWGSFYSQVRRGELQVLAIAASHQRLAWVHPFRDGNGRVARLHTHLALAQAGLTNGLWSPLRGFARTQDAYYAHLAVADEPRAGDLDGRGNLSEAALVQWIAYVLAQCADQVTFMTQMLQLDGMKGRIAACLAFEENAGQHGVRTEALRGLHYLFATQGELERADFKAMLGLGDRLATAQVSALLARGLLQSDSPYGKLRFGVPQHALRFYFPRLWSEAEVDS